MEKKWKVYGKKGQGVIAKEPTPCECCRTNPALLCGYDRPVTVANTFHILSTYFPQGLLTMFKGGAVGALRGGSAGTALARAQGCHVQGETVQPCRKWR